MDEKKHEKGPLPGPTFPPAGTPVAGPAISPAHLQTAVTSPQQQLQHQVTNPFFPIPLKRTPGVNIRDEFNPIRARRAVSAPVPRPEDVRESPLSALIFSASLILIDPFSDQSVAIVWQYSGRRVLSSIHHGPHGLPPMMMHHQQQMQHPTGMYNLHMNGIVVNPTLAMHGGGGGVPPPIVTPGAGVGAPNGLSPHMPVQGLEDERFSPSPQLGIGPGGPGGFNRMPHQVNCVSSYWWLMKSIR